jgi:hypothetical protein
MPLPAGDIVANGYDNKVFNLGDIAWVLTSTALVWIMIPGIAFFYSGLLRRKNALSQLWVGMVGIGVVSFQVSLKPSLIFPGRLLQVDTLPYLHSGSFGVTLWLSHRVQTPSLVI